jgi:hypothetical protein
MKVIPLSTTAFKICSAVASSMGRPPQIRDPRTSIDP